VRCISCLTYALSLLLHHLLSECFENKNIEKDVTGRVADLYFPVYSFSLKEPFYVYVGRIAFHINININKAINYTG
jgi:hypothetical protein